MKKLLIIVLLTMVLGGNVLVTQAANCVHENVTVKLESRETNYTHMTTISGLNGTIAPIDCNVRRKYLTKRATCDWCGIIVESWQNLMNEFHSVSHN